MDLKATAIGRRIMSRVFRRFPELDTGDQGQQASTSPGSARAAKASVPSPAAAAVTAATAVRVGMQGAAPNQPAGRRMTPMMPG